MSRFLASFQEPQNALRFCVEAFLIIILALFCSQLFWKIMAPSELSTGALAAPAQAGPVYAKATNTEDFNILWTSNPFAPSDRTALRVNEAALNAPETSLNLTLKGVRANGEGEGVAFILLPDNRQVNAGIGIEILDNVEVKYVFEDRVTLLTRGELETLYLRDPDSPRSVLDNSEPERRETAAQRPAESAAQNRATTKTVSAQDFLRSVGLTVVRERGERTGYLLTPRSDPAILISAGFKPGDIIRGVNDRQVSQIDGEELQELLLRSGVADFDVERAGETVRVSVRFLGGDRR